MAKVRAITVHTAMLSALHEMKEVESKFDNLGEEAKAEAFKKVDALFDQIDSFYDQSVSFKTHVIWQEALLIHDILTPEELYELEEEIA